MNTKGTLTEKVHKLENQLAKVTDELSMLRNEIAEIHASEKQAGECFRAIIDDLQRLNHCKEDKSYC